MKVTVFGASGGTGVQLLRRALGGGHEVTAVVRDPARLPVEAHPHLSVVTADGMDPGAIVPAVTGSYAVVSALGSREGRAPTTVCADGARSIIQAMRKAGARQLAVVSNSGMVIDGEDGPITRLVVKPILQKVLTHPYAGAELMEDEVRTSDLDWTIMRPPMLTDGAYTGRYRTAVDRNVRGGTRVSRADLADDIVSLLDDPSSFRTTTSIAW